MAKQLEISAEPKHVLGIDSLRALAVWVVVVYHLNATFLPGGFVGVDIFFAISGFVITKSLLERTPKSLISFFTGFYRRRFIRIAPALFIYLMVVTTLSSYFIPKASFSGGIFETARWAIFGASNVQLVATNDGYFAERMDFNPFIQTWSLGVEEQFYLLYPLFIAFLVFAIAKSRAVFSRIVIAALGLLTLASLYISAQQTNSDFLSAFYLLPARFWELAAGGLLYILVTRAERFANLGSNTKRILIALALLLLVPSLTIADIRLFPFWWAIPPVLAALILIHISNTASSDSKSVVAKIVTARPIVYFGKISYSLYLWHWGVFVLMRWTVGLTLWWHYLLAIALTILVSAFSYRFIETPVRTGKFFRKMPDWQVIFAGVLVAAMTISVTSFGKSEWVRRAHAVTDPVFQDSAAITKVLKTIPASNIGAGHSLIFVGDSHAGHFKYISHWIASKTGADVSRIIHYGCGYANLQAVSTRLSVCPTDEAVTSEIIKKTKPGDIVVLSSFSTPRMAASDGPFNKEELLGQLNAPAREAGRAEALALATEVVKSLQSHGLNVILAAPTPVFITPADRCNKWFNKINPICSYGFKQPIGYEEQLRAPVMKSYKALATATGITLWDPFPYLCNDGKYCYSRKDGRYMFVDQHHLTANGNLLLVKSFLTELETIW